MKKAVIIVSVLVLVLSVMSACGDKNDAEAVSTTVSDTTRGDKYVTTASKYTVGDVQTSEKVAVNDNEYHIAYYDADGIGAKVEIYRGGKLAYYYTSSSVDEDGNCLQQKYYSADGRYLGAFDNGYFFDANGKQISEDEMEANLNK